MRKVCPMSFHYKNIKQGKEGEKAFANWLNKNDFGFFEFKQNMQDMADTFKGSVKRPDFFVLLPSMGFIAVDVKNYTMKDGNFTLGIDKELAPSMEFERLFRLYLWYAFKDVSSDSDEWYFISAYDAIEHGNHRVNGDTGEKFLSISKNKFTLIKKRQDMNRLFKHRVGSVGTLARLVEGYFATGRI